MQHSLNVQRLRGFDRIQIESAGIPPEVEHAIESVRPVRPMRFDESFEPILVAGIHSFEITGKDLAGWGGWEFRGRSRLGQAQRKSGNKERENAAHAQLDDLERDGAAAQTSETSVAFRHFSVFKFLCLSL